MTKQTDPVERLVADIKQMVAKSGINLYTRELQVAGDIYERYGLGTAKNYLLGKGRPSDRLLVKVLERVQEEPEGSIPREVVAYTIRHLNQIIAYKEVR